MGSRHWHRLWRPGTFILLLLGLIYTIWLEEPLLDWIEETVEEDATGALAAFGRFILSNPFLIPLSIIVLLLSILVLHAYIETRPRQEDARKTADRAVAQRPQPDLGPEPRDPNKGYGARLEWKASGAGRYRIITSSLHDTGDGWDRGVELEVILPSGAVRRVYGWRGLDVPLMRRAVGKGAAFSAEAAGPYTIRWRNHPLPQYQSEVIAEETVTLETTGPLDNWIATHHSLEDRLVLEVLPTGESTPSLQGFECHISGPGGNFTADDRRREEVLGLIRSGEYPTPKLKGHFVYRQDFGDEYPEIRDLRDGMYTVFWTAWELDPVGGVFEYIPVDVARDSFQVLRNGRVV